MISRSNTDFIKRMTDSLWDGFLKAVQLFDIRRDDFFMAQCCYESGWFKNREENLRYSTPERIVKIFKKYVPDLETAKKYVKKPEALANLVYGARLGNTEPGDGWKYRGRGFIQLTGKANYALMGKHLDMDLVSDPDIVCQDKYAFFAAGWFWVENNLNDLEDFELVTQKINGGFRGLDKRIEILKKLNGGNRK